MRFDKSTILSGGMEVVDNIHSMRYLDSKKVDFWLRELHNLLMDRYGASSENAAKFSTTENWRDYIIDGYSPEEALEEDSQHWDLGGDSPHSCYDNDFPYDNFDEYWSAV